MQRDPTPLNRNPNRNYRKDEMPRDGGYIAQRQDVNYVKQNQRNIVNEHQRPAPPTTEEKNAVIHKPKDYGKVPQYLNKYKKEREEADR